MRACPIPSIHAATGQDEPLPVDAVIGELIDSLDRDGVAVLQAPPGSGKTTRVPLALLGAAWLEGRRILVLEPRRVAARAVAGRMASTLDERPGGRVGYRIRQERRTSAATRIEVVTEGVLTRMLQADPSLDGVGVVIFDEYHERSIQTDLGLALSLDARAGLRPDLKILVMSATLETARVASLLDNAPVISVDATAHPVETVWLGRPRGSVESAVTRAVLRALEDQSGDVLAFLPGAGEIRRVETLVGQAAAQPGPASTPPAPIAAPPGATAAPAASSTDVVPLYGALSAAAQDAALRPGKPGRRKVVLATSIAETSLTIDGVGAVVDSGLMRVPRFDPAAGMTRLVTVPVSRASADQRRGRAGRQGPGLCYRLWAATDHAGLPRATPPEILVADLAPLALDLAEWGVDDPRELRWADPPPETALGAARSLLTELGAIDANRRITRHGRALARLGTHPRIGHLLIRARDMEARAPGTTLLAADIAAVLSEGDPLHGTGRETGSDLTARIVTVRRGHAPRHTEAARRWGRLLALPGPPARHTAPPGPPARHTASPGPPARHTAASVPVIPEEVGRLVALAYPDRVGRQRQGRPGHWLLRSGRGAWTPETDSMATAEWMVAADLDGDRRDARVWLGAPLHADDVEALFADDIVTADRVEWDDQRADVVAVRERRLGAIVIGATPLDRPPEGRSAALIEGIVSAGLGLLPWTPELDLLRARVAFARRLDGDQWADLSDDALIAELDSWLEPWLDGRSRRADLASLPLGDALWNRIGWERRRALDELAPRQLTLPTGERRRLDYPAEGPPVLAARLQELFGTTATPTVAGGRVPVLIHLLSPAGRPVQVTTDLANFWATTYYEVRSELRARYPRHAWPDRPAAALPTGRARPRHRT